MHIGDIIKEHRLACGYSTDDVADRMGVYPSTYWRKEAGKTPFTASELEFCAKLFNTKVSTLYEELEKGGADKRRAAWNAAYDLLGPSRANDALRFLVGDKSRKSKKTQG